MAGGGEAKETPAAHAHAGEEAYARGLKARHISLIALGGVIGVGLFLGSGAAIQRNGPGLVLAYAVAGAAIYLIMRALGELVVYRPVAGAFATYAHDFVGPWAGFVTGWSYWFVWVTMGMAEITAIAVFVRFWLPDIPQWIPALVALGVLYAVNLAHVRLFGEMEFWFALIKVATILVMIGIGLAALLFGVGALSDTAHLSNLWAHGGVFPTGLLGVVTSLQLVVFAYQGIELIAVTAGEAQDPAGTLAPAINNVIWRILIFYIGALLIIMSVLPWTVYSAGVSPFVQVFQHSGIPAAAGIVNFVVLTSAASACNSGLFSTGRMLRALALRGHAPAPFGRLNVARVPAAGITFSALVMLGGVLMNYLVPDRVFLWITSISTVGGLWTWGIIMWSHLAYRKAVAQGKAHPVAFRMPGAPYANWIVMAFLAMVAAFLSLNADTRVALYVAPVWFALLFVGYRVAARRKARG